MTAAIRACIGQAHLSLAGFRLRFRRGHIIARAWEAYRASQQLPFSVDRMRAQTALFRLLDSHTRTGESWTNPDAAAIRKAAAALTVLARQGGSVAA
jgi:hypothetical protein